MLLVLWVHALMGLTLLMVDAVGSMSDGNDCAHTVILIYCARVGVCWCVLVVTAYIQYVRFYTS